MPAASSATVPLSEDDSHAVPNLGGSGSPWETKQVSFYVELCSRSGQAGPPDVGPPAHTHTPCPSLCSCRLCAWLTRKPRSQLNSSSRCPPGAQVVRHIRALGTAADTTSMASRHRHPPASLLHLLQNKPKVPTSHW